MLHSAARYYQWTEKSMEYLSPLFSWQVYKFLFFFLIFLVPHCVSTLSFLFNHYSDKLPSPP